MAYESSLITRNNNVITAGISATLEVIHDICAAEERLLESLPCK